MTVTSTGYASEKLVVDLTAALSEVGGAVPLIDQDAAQESRFDEFETVVPN